MIKTQTICSECGRPIPAAYIRKDGAVYLEKTCPEHGTSRALASEDAEAFERWVAFPSVTVPPRVFITKGARGAFGEVGIVNTECPIHCGVCENHLMTACCVLLNVTDRCNQHCPYCFAAAGSPGPGAAADPSLADIERWLCRLVELGEERKFNIQLSGGEPTVREDLADIIRMCKEKDFEYIQLNTNGRLLAADLVYAKTLKAAGLSTVFLQFDGVDDDVYTALRGEPLLETKKAAIKNCGAAGLPVTLVPTVLKNTNLAQTGAIIDFMLDNISVVKGVHFQPASFFGRRPDERNEDGDYDERVTMFSVMDEIEKQTGGRVKKADLAPISTGHPLCCFCAAYMKEKGGFLRPLSSGGSCCDSEGDEPGGGSCCGPGADEPGGGSCCGPGADPLEIIRRDRDFVLNKWEINQPEETSSGDNAQNGTGNCNTNGCGDSSGGCCDSSGDGDGCDGGGGGGDSSGDGLPEVDGAMSFDEALAMFRNNMFTISGMAFMDGANLDAERLRRCRVQVFTPDERLIPFCAYYAYHCGK